MLLQAKVGRRSSVTRQRRAKTTCFRSTHTVQCQRGTSSSSWGIPCAPRTGGTWRSCAIHFLLSFFFFKGPFFLCRCTRGPPFLSFFWNGLAMLTDLITRTPGWHGTLARSTGRYTVWCEFDCRVMDPMQHCASKASVQPKWDKVIGVELYDHRQVCFP